MKSESYWKERYERYIRTCTRALTNPVPYDEWFKWHNPTK